MNVGSMLERMSARYAKAVAVADGGQSWTYEELNRRSNKVANLLISRYGIKKGDRIALLCHNRLEVAEVMYGVAKAGGVYIGLNFRLDWSDYAVICDNAQPKLVISEPGLAHHAEHISAEFGIPVLDLDGAGDDDYQTGLAAASELSPPTLYEVDAGDEFMIAYTSGTTGRPKGNLFDHRALLTHALVWDIEFRFDASTRVLLCLPHNGAAQVALLPAHMVGGSVRFFDNRSVSAEALCDLIDTYGVTDTYTVPTQLYRLLDHLQTSDTQLPSIRTFGYGAAPIAPDRLRLLVDRLGTRFQQLYGMSEVCGLATMLHKEDHALAQDGRSELFGSVGRPSFMMAVRVVDEKGSDLPVGEPGEVIFRSPYIMKQYNREPQRTANTLKDGWVYSGDVGRFDRDGYLFIVGRVKDLIIRGGQNVAPREIEDRLLAHPGVSEASVVGVPDPEWGEAIVAVIVPRAGVQVTVDDIRDWCRAGGLASIKIPTSTLMVETLPKNLMGKIDKRATLDLVLQS
jgi:acyl-CoA synthetase (AMP-forming)/AMP-acid ligase II